VGTALYYHNTTGPSNLWVSASTAASVYSFTHPFTSAGTFPYICSYHVIYGMSGSVTVEQGSGNVPPTVTIVGPANNATFAAPWTGTVRATATDPDDTISQVDFYANSTLLGTVRNPSSSLSLGVTNLAAGTYALKAVATDSRGSTNGSAFVTLRLLAPAPITLSSIKRPSPGSFQFGYSATPGLSYVVGRSSTPGNFLPISTNAATNATMTFIDSTATNKVNFYRLNVLPNP
jgi:Big-like domain-containing protein